MPTNEHVLGFANRWYPEAVATSRTLSLPSGARVRVISAPVFIATKLEAFATRGGADVVASHDFEDIINVIDGRPELLAEITAASTDLIHYLAEKFAEISRQPDFDNALPGLVAYDDLHEERVRQVASVIQGIVALKP